MPSEQVQRWKEARAKLHESRRLPELTPKERKYYPAELAEAIRLIETVAERLEKGGESDQWLARDLRGIARGVDGHAKRIARSLAERPLRRFANRFINPS